MVFEKTQGLGAVVEAERRNSAVLVIVRRYPCVSITIKNPSDFAGVIDRQLSFPVERSLPNDGECPVFDFLTDIAVQVSIDRVKIEIVGDRRLCWLA
jgi:hypothetical protein